MPNLNDPDSKTLPDSPDGSVEEITLEEFMNVAEDYHDLFPDHPGFNSLTLAPDSLPFLTAYQQMLECILGERDEPVTDESIGVSYPEGVDI